MNAACVAEDNKYCVFFFLSENLMEVKNVRKLLASELWVVLVAGSH